MVWTVPSFRLIYYQYFLIIKFELSSDQIQMVFTLQRMLQSYRINFKFAKGICLCGNQAINKQCINMFMVSYCYLDVCLERSNITGNFSLSNYYFLLAKAVNLQYKNNLEVQIFLKRRMKQSTNSSYNKFSTNFNPTKQHHLHSQLQSVWKTNLMIQSQVQRVAQRDLIFHKRTSFEEGLINDHINEMLKVIISTGLKLSADKVSEDDQLYAQNCQNKQIEVIVENQYLTEEQKWEIKQSIFVSQQNFSILMRLSSVFKQNKDQLVYILCKILQFSTVDLPVKQKYNSKKQTLLQLMSKNMLKLMDKIMNQEIIKVVNPLFFSNFNQLPLMRIIQAWFYHTLCIKQGLYGDDLKLYIELQETCFEQENYFQM